MKNKNMTFEILPWAYNSEDKMITCRYRCSVYGDFSEYFILPETKHDIATAAPYLNLLSWLVGLSYYKAAAAPHIKGPLYNPSFETAIKAFYQKGLGEFFIRNELSYPYSQSFEFISEAHAPTAVFPYISRETPPKALCAFGGGKDSYTALSLLKQAKIETTLLSVMSGTRVTKTLTESSLTPLIFIKRVLDPKIIELNKQGALNGHIPITAILSTLFMIYAILNEYAYVVFANEHAASEATVTLESIEANHQYSKSFEAENLLRDCFAVVENGPDYFSILRPFSELYIAKKFASFKQAHPLFLSCNQNFQISKTEKEQRWCHHCPKCAFVFLILAPFLSQKELMTIFDHNILDDLTLIDTYKDLLGLTDKKPWECVGTIDECRAAFYYISKQPDWENSALIKQLLPLVLEQTEGAVLESLFDEKLSFRGPHNIPVEVYNQ